MYQNNFKQLLIIDDDCCHNIICALALKKLFRSSDVNMIGFTNSEEGMEHIMQSTRGTIEKTILFLDINMPRLSGWEILERLEQLPRAVKKQLEVYVITASPNYYDEQKALKSPLVKRYLEKPLSNHLHFIFEKRNMLQLSVA